MKGLLLFLLLLLFLAWLTMRILRGDRTVQKEASTAKLGSTSQFHAVSLKYSANACDAAKAMTGRRFLASAAPRLPLPECDALECRCAFAHHDDRRSGTDRRNPFNTGTFATGTGKMPMERRSRKDRRRQPEGGNP